MEAPAGNKLGATVFTACAFIAFVLFVIGTPEPFYSNGSTHQTLWAGKTPGGSTSAATEFSGCPSLKTRFQAMEAFSIISIAFSLGCLIVGILGVVGVVVPRVPGGVLAILTSISSVIVWAIAANLHNQSYCGGTFSAYSYDAGFGLFVTGWCVITLAVILVFVL